MNVKDLMAILTRLDPETEVVIDVQVPYDSIGPTPSAAIKHAVKGFDWENGTVRLCTEQKLVLFNEEQYKHFCVMKTEARKERSDAWNKLNIRSMSYEESIEVSKDIDKNVHPLFKGSYNER